MPPAPVTPDQLRQRAGVLRRLASKLDLSLAVDLHRRAAEDTWLGPTPRRCHEELLTIRAAIVAAGHDLQVRAAALEQRAGQLDLPRAG